METVYDLQPRLNYPDSMFIAMGIMDVIFEKDNTLNKKVLNRKTNKAFY